VEGPRRGPDYVSHGARRIVTVPRKTRLDRKAGQIRTHPVVANGRRHPRDQDLPFCFDVSLE